MQASLYSHALVCPTVIRKHDAKSPRHPEGAAISPRLVTTEFSFSLSLTAAAMLWTPD
jgi:hypothetical protein